MKELVLQPKSRLWLAKYFSMMVVVMLSVYYAVPTRRRYDPNSTAVAFVHLMSFAMHFGAQCWVTFIAGLTMFYNLPRIMFGQVQSRLFPMYFATTLLLSSITLITYTIRNPYETWTRPDWKLVIVLTICVLSTFINTYFIAPQIVDAMQRCFEIEVEAGVAYVIGYVDKTELKKNQTYSHCYRAFRRHHGMSAIANITTLARLLKPGDKALGLFINEDKEDKWEEWFNCEELANLMNGEMYRVMFCDGMKATLKKDRIKEVE